VANKHTIVVILSVIVIAASLGYSSLNLFSANNLQFRWYQADSFDLLSIMFGGKMSVCNNSDYPAAFSSYSFDVIYEEQNLGTFTVNGAGLAPHTNTMVDGKFATDNKQVANILFASLDTALSGSGQAARINPNHMTVITTLETKIIGLVPFSVTQQYSGDEFVQMMGQKTSCDE
jgi:hypothetical protein